MGLATVRMVAMSAGWLRRELYGLSTYVLYVFRFIIVPTKMYFCMRSGKLAYPCGSRYIRNKSNEPLLDIFRVTSAISLTRKLDARTCRVLSIFQFEN